MKIKNLCKTYATKTREKVHALKNVSFDLPSSGMVVILGKSGCGKSTLLNILGGLDRFDSGDVECFGKSLKSLSRKELDDYRNSCVGFVFQEYNLIPELDVFDNIALPLQLQGQTDNDEKVKSALEQVGMSGFERRKVEELSGGQKQRVAIARALVKDAKIILADEPTGALDSHSGENILKILKWISQEKLVVLVTHDRDFAERYGDRIIELADGVVIRDSGDSYLDTDTYGMAKVRKSRLPIKAAFKIGRSNFRHNRLRLLSTILMSVIAFSLLGVSLTIAFMNPAKAFSDAIIRDGMEFTAIYKYEYYEDPTRIDQSLDQYLGEPLTPTREVPITMKDIESLKDQVDNSYTLVYTDLIYSFQKSIAASLDEMNEARKQNPEICYGDIADGYIAMTEAECKRMDFTIIGELPKNPDEVAINECLFNIFSIKGLIENNQTFEISSYEDIIGHKLSIVSYAGADDYKTVTGVVITGCNRECFNWHHGENEQNKECYHEKIFVCQDYFDGYTYALCPIPQDKTELTKLINYILESEENDEYFKIRNRLSLGFYSAERTASLVKMLFLYLSIIFLFFAVLLLSSCILTSMRRQMKQIGILSALGASFEDLCKVYGSTILAICSIVAAISLIIQISSIRGINAYLDSCTNNLFFDLLSFSLPAALLLLLIVAVVAFASCFIPLIHLRKLEPTTIINKGQIK